MPIMIYKSIHEQAIEKVQTDKGAKLLLVELLENLDHFWYVQDGQSKSALLKSTKAFFDSVGIDT